MRLALEQKDAARPTDRDIVTLQHKFEIEHKYNISTRLFALWADGRIPLYYFRP